MVLAGPTAGSVHSAQGTGLCIKRGNCVLLTEDSSGKLQKSEREKMLPRSFFFVFTLYLLWIIFISRNGYRRGSGIAG